MLAIRYEDYNKTAIEKKTRAAVQTGDIAKLAVYRKALTMQRARAFAAYRIRGKSTAVDERRSFSSALMQRQYANTNVIFAVFVKLNLLGFYIEFQT
jgi:hypothetical protein